MITQTIREVIKAVPSVRVYLSERARFALYEPVEYKTYDYMLVAIEGLVRGVYNGQIAGQFIDTMANLISGQFTQAYQQAFEDEGFTDFNMPDYLNQSLEEAILRQYDYVDQYYRDVIDARVDQTPIDPLIARAALWAQRYTESYNEAVRLISVNNGGKLMWVEGDTMQKCSTCLALDGIIAFASEWDTLGVKPQHAPNSKLECDGWKCECQLVPTDKRRSPGAYVRIDAAVMGI
jgi:hypothetical protein